MWFEFFRFDLRYQLRQPLLWVSGLVFALMAFGAASSDAVTIGGAVGNVYRNAPMVIAQFLGVFTIIAMFIVTIFVAGSVLRDTEMGMSDMIFATPMKKRDYLIGRFLAGQVACLAIFVLLSLGIMLGTVMPWVDVARIGPFSILPYLWGFAVLVIPNLLLIGALLMLLAATTRSMLLVYVGVIAFFVLWSVAGVFSRDISNEWVAVLADPFGMRAFGRMTRYFTTAEANSGLPPFSGFLLANRALWVAVALALLGLTLALFKPQRADTGKHWFGRAKSLGPTAAVAIGAHHSFRPLAPTLNANTAWLQCWHTLRFDAAGVFKSIPFLVMLLVAVANFVGGALAGGKLYGTEVYPVTRLMLENLNGSFNFLLVLIVTFYGGELIFKERQSKLDEVLDAMPQPNWVPLVAKSLALVAVVAGFVGCGVLAAMIFQWVKGATPVELGLYLQGALLGSAYFVLMGWLGVAFQVFFNNKFIGYLAVILVMVAQVVLALLHFDHNLYTIAGLPQAVYSDMNGYGHFLTGWSWYLLYWGLFVLALLILAQAFWVRGLSHEWRVRRQLARARLRGNSGIALALCLGGFLATGVWIFYNTNVLNEYVPGDVAMDRQANYEKLYRQYKGLPQPRVTEVQANVDIFPAERRVVINGHYRVLNRHATALDTLYVQVVPDVETVLKNLPAHQITVDDQVLGMRILKLAQPLQPGAAIDMDFTVTVRNHGFTNSGAPDTINLNGTFFNDGQLFPALGYNANRDLLDRNERRKRGMGEPQRTPKLEDEAARRNHQLDSQADWVSFETTVSTSVDQIALAPGYLQKTWEQEGRRYFHYKMDRPMLPFFAYLSARWRVKKGDWHGLPIEVYFDAKHGYNVDRMITATQKSLDYFSAHFTPYQHRQVRILEFPRYASFAQAFANTIPYSEAIGFIADLRDKEDVDYVFYVTAHEMAHQWWAHQVIGANVQGATMLVESLAQYSALMVMEKEYGRAHLRKFFKDELDKYLLSRRGEQIEELPLFRVENQPYIHYRKGALVFYRLREEIGEAALNRALKRFLQDKAYQAPPYTTSRELLTYIRAEARADQQDLITDLFEKIVFYDNRVMQASAKQRPDGQWDVTMKLHLAKLEADGAGKETPRVYDEPVEIAVFSRPVGGKESTEKVLFNDKRRLLGAEPSVTVTVKEKPYDVGVDPYNKMIDRVSTDNRKQVSFE
jgi:ABC-type transport system involved in multi-copper enzyme maturation permease subunit